MVEMIVLKDREEWLKKLPVCTCCGEPIQQEKAVNYDDKWFCVNCEHYIWDDIRSDYFERTEANV